MGTGAATPPEPPGRQSARFASSGRKPNEKLVKRKASFCFEHVFCAYPDNSSSRQSRAAGGPARRPQRLWRVRTEDSIIKRSLMSMSNGNDQANRTISTGKLHALPHFHTQPINVVVFHGSQGNTRFQVGFPLRCLQRLSIPYIATLLCPWQDNRSTRDMSIPVLSY
jgi:hypothetical protein